MLQAILDYQKIDGELLSFDKELRNAESRKRTAKAKQIIEEGGASLEKLNLRAGEVIANYNRLQAKVAELNAEIAEYLKMAESSESEDELNYFAKKVAKLDELLKQTERETQELANDSNEIAASFDDLKKRIVKAQEEYKQSLAKYRALQEEKKPEREKILARLAEVEKSVPEKWIQGYKKVREGNIFPVVVPLMGDNMCGGCRMELSMSAVSNLNTAKIIRCEECGRLIYKK